MLHTVPWWAVPPAHEVSVLVGADPDLLSLSLDPLPDGAPAVVEFRPVASHDTHDYVEILLNELDKAALGLFPRWLPGAERLDGSHALSAAAVRALAGQMAAASSNFGPFLAELAERGLKTLAGQAAASGSRRPAEVRAAGLVRVLAAAYGRTSAALLIHMPDGMSLGQQRALTASAEWLAHHARLSVWLVGAVGDTDRVRSVTVSPPADLRDLTDDVPGGASDAAGQAKIPSFVAYPPLSGVPRWDSPAELALEKALARYEWSAGRHWNYTYLHHILAKPYRLDVFWPDEGLVVEVDGKDHRNRLKYADDRRRDVRLQLLGFDVLRFTNEQVLSDITIVLHEIRQILSQRRSNAVGRSEMRQHAQR